ncbi:MAG TPA: methyltransferase domain-containing protein [Bacteroidota bacterium]|nr:methyltransferase domain-containing protein [Bacteroidota bacterium]
MSNKIQRFNKSASAESSKPDEILRILDLKPGMNVLEIGVGGGYFNMRIAERVGKSGVVYGVDADPAFIENLRSLNKQNQNDNIRPILFKSVQDVLALGQIVDLVFTRNAYHHLHNRVEYFKSIAPILKPGCTIAILDHSEYPFNMIRLMGHFTEKKIIVEEQEKAGNVLVRDVEIFKKQNFLLFRKP